LKILILGGTGAMGTSLVSILSRRRDNNLFITSRKRRISQRDNVEYIQGNAHDNNFLIKLLSSKYYDTVIDFMAYSTDEFKLRIDLFLKHTAQYIYISSSRVYANENKCITEKTKRLLDICKDNEYLETDEYALTKARQENLLLKSKKRNWTIIRPYITYNVERLQLGAYEKENWLYRALHGRSIIFNKDIANKFTTLTYGYDVALRIADIIGKEKALGEIMHITTFETKKWKDILNLYLDIIENKTGKRPNVCWLDTSIDIGKIAGNKYQIKYDRLYDRCFDNRKINNISECKEKYMSLNKGLKICLEKFIDENRKFLDISWKLQAYMDKMAGEKTPLKEIPTLKGKIKYVICRYFLF
jgi:nucleoside-diphosphate-sugar epimerase